MAEELFNLFDSKPDEPILPSADQPIDEGLLTEKDIRLGIKSANELISEGLERAIGGTKVNSIMVPQENSLALPNYVIDIDDADSVAEWHTEALDSFLDPDGDVII